MTSIFKTREPLTPAQRDTALEAAGVPEWIRAHLRDGKCAYNHSMIGNTLLCSKPTPEDDPRRH